MDVLTSKVNDMLRDCNGDDDDDTKQKQQSQQGNGDDDIDKQQQQQHQQADGDDDDDSNDFHKTLMKVLKGYFNDYKKLSNDSCTINHHHHHHGNGNDNGNDTHHHHGNDDHGHDDDDDDNMRRVRYTSSYQLRVFISSTFTDTHYERNILLDEIVPVLKGIAAPYGIEVVFIDMRYGVRDENTLDHMTWLACKNELNACIKLSNGIFFLSLQGMHHHHHHHHYHHHHYYDYYDYYHHYHSHYHYLYHYH